jgi:glycosyltransferase involved in cell wall biosynthesis
MRVPAWPVISIVTPNFNYAHFLGDTLRSVVDQDYPALEYTVLDGGSSDGSIDIIRAYGDRISTWRSRPDDGHYAAVNEGLDEASGEILGWLNSDDILLPGALKTVGDIFRSRPDVSWLTTAVAGQIGPGGALTATRLPGFSRDSFFSGRHLMGYRRRGYSFIQQESTFWRRSLWEKVGGLRSELKLAADFALWADFFSHAELHVTDAMLGAFRVHDTNRSADMCSYGQEASRVLAELQRKAPTHEPFLRATFAGTRVARLPTLRQLAGYRSKVIEWAEVGERSGWVVRERRFL